MEILIFDDWLYKIQSKTQEGRWSKGRINLRDFINIFSLLLLGGSRSSDSDPLSLLSSLETNRCKPNRTFVWCLPFDYNQEKHPFSCKSFSVIHYSMRGSDRHQFELILYGEKDVQTEDCNFSNKSSLCIPNNLSDRNGIHNLWYSGKASNLQEYF